MKDWEKERDWLITYSSVLWFGWCNYAYLFVVGESKTFNFNTIRYAIAEAARCISGAITFVYTINHVYFVCFWLLLFLLFSYFDEMRMYACLFCFRFAVNCLLHQFQPTIKPNHQNTTKTIVALTEKISKNQRTKKCIGNKSKRKKKQMKEEQEEFREQKKM